MTVKTETWIDTLTFSSVPAGVSFFGALAAHASLQAAGIAAGVAFFGTLAAHFKTSPSEVPSTPQEAFISTLKAKVPPVATPPAASTTTP